MMIPYKKINRIVTDIMGPGVHDVIPLKKGITNNSYIFTCRGQRYVLRLNGAGTERLINRKGELESYTAISSCGISDEIIAIDADKGYKITRFVENAHNCNPYNGRDVKLCMEKLRHFHKLKIKSGSIFDLYGTLEYYETLWTRRASKYKDYAAIKKQVYALKPMLDTIDRNSFVLTHMDPVSDNFLITDTDQVYLIDWEYAGMQDMYVDLAMFAIYTGYTRAETDRLINVYFDGACPDEIYWRIYAYQAIGGLLWSNWCEFKEDMGIYFDTYPDVQYRYAKDCSKLALNMLMS
ncbi:MAG: choline/ethanolamine kinase family protein [Dialister sp.]|nr:choline/ethanolamine kinase family protein [Dialister sp.]